MFVKIIDPDDGSIVSEWENDPKSNCSGCGNGATSEMCGGCGGCLEMQAAFSGFLIKYEE